MVNYRRVGMFVIAAITVPTVVVAQPLVDNMDQPTSAVTILGTQGDDLLWGAQSFFSPACFTLTSIDVYMGQRSGDVVPIVYIAAGADPTGAVVATLLVPPLTDGPVEEVTLALDEPVVLPAGHYWLVIGPQQPDPKVDVSFGWAYALGNIASGEGYLGEYAYSLDYGATWCCPGTDNPYQVRINGEITLCRADFTCDGFSSGDDFDAFVATFELGEPAADFNGDGFVTGDDFDAYVEAFDIGC